jgi:hypothetical protein
MSRSTPDVTASLDDFAASVEGQPLLKALEIPAERALTRKELSDWRRSIVVESLDLERREQLRHC